MNFLLQQVNGNGVFWKKAALYRFTKLLVCRLMKTDSRDSTMQVNNTIDFLAVTSP